MFGFLIGIKPNSCLKAKTDAEIKSAVSSGIALPTSMGDYSYNALEGTYSTSSASRPLTSVPRIPDSPDHGGDDGQSDYRTDIEAKVTSVIVPSQIFLPDDGSIDYNMYISSKYKLSKLVLTV